MTGFVCTAGERLSRASGSCLPPPGLRSTLPPCRGMGGASLRRPPPSAAARSGGKSAHGAVQICCRCRWTVHRWRRVRRRSGGKIRKVHTTRRKRLQNRHIWGKKKRTQKRIVYGGPMFDPKLKALGRVQKPGRYTGGEPAVSIKKRWMCALPSASGYLRGGNVLSGRKDPVRLLNSHEKLVVRARLLPGWI